MAMSSCPKCNNHLFEMVGNTPVGAQYQLTFVQCAKCGAVVGVMNSHNIARALATVAVAVGEIAQALNVDVDLSL